MFLIFLHVPLSFLPPLTSLLPSPLHLPPSLPPSLPPFPFSLSLHLDTCHRQDDEFTHLYTLIVRPDNTYEVKIDNKRAEGGSLDADWDFLAPKTIPDPEAHKPTDWDDRPKIDDVDDTKPDVSSALQRTGA